MQRVEELELHKKKKKFEKDKKRINENGFLEENADYGGVLKENYGGEVEEDEIRLRRNGSKEKKREQKVTEDKQVLKEMGHMGWENEKDEGPKEEVEIELSKTEERKRQKRKRNKEKKDISSTLDTILVKVFNSGDQMAKKDKEVGKDKRDKRKERNENREDYVNANGHAGPENENIKGNLDLGLKKAEECEEMGEIEFKKYEKKRKKDNKNKEIVNSCSSLTENIVNLLDGGNCMGRVKEVGKGKTNDGTENSMEEVGIGKSKITTKNNKKKKKRDKVGSDKEPFESNFFKEMCNSITRTGKIKEIGQGKDNIDGNSMIRVEYLKKKKEKNDMDVKVTASFLTEVPAKELISVSKLLTEDKGGEEEQEGQNTSSNIKKKRKKETEVIGVELDRDDNKERKKNKRDKEQESNKAFLEEIPTKLFGSENNLIPQDKGIVNCKADKGTSSIKKGEGSANHITNSQPMKKSKRVSFSGHVEVFHLTDDMNLEETCRKDLVQGKRYSRQEDELVKEAVSNYILDHGLGEEGLDMILHCRDHPKLRNCWKEIGATLPWRPYLSVYHRAHLLYEGAETSKWHPKEYEIIRSFRAKHGSDWKTLAGTLGRNRLRIKDTWRRIRLPDLKKGPWSQDEFQTLFDLVNMDLRMKAFEEKKTKHGMLRDNISWEAISDKLSTRHNANCCQKWYHQLSSPMVAEGIWADSDDYRLVDMLTRLDACCVEDVDWDNLLEHRCGEVCHKRWNQMTKHIGRFRDKSFSEQVEVLANRYCSDLLNLKDPDAQGMSTDL